MDLVVRMYRYSILFVYMWQVVACCLHGCNETDILSEFGGWGNQSSENDSNNTENNVSLDQSFIQKNGQIELLPATDLQDERFDSVIVVVDSLDRLTGGLAVLKEPLQNYSTFDSAMNSQPVLVITDAVPSGRVFYSSTGRLDRDYDDVRRYADAAMSAVERAMLAGCKRPLLVRPDGGPFEMATVVAALAVLEAAYRPYEMRQKDYKFKLEALGIWCSSFRKCKRGLPLIRALETGRIVARDIAGSDPEVMNPVNVEAYVLDVFKDTNVTATVESDVDVIRREYPLFGAVDRAAQAVPRHRGRLIQLEYTGLGEIKRTLFLVGKGVTYDTGGASIKTGGRMLSMSRDKSGAAAVAGFMKVLAILKPKNIKVVGAMPIVRNSVGADSYVPDEVITSRAGVRVRVINSDAEGRMIMADVLCKMKELALEAVNPHLVTIATLTGHAVNTVGSEYTILMDNGPAREQNYSETMQATAEAYGDFFEISRIRREDYANHKGSNQQEDIRQTGRNSRRGHQGPAAFLIMSSGLDQHGLNSDHPLVYSHMDIAGSAKFKAATAPGVPVVGLTARYLFEAHLID